LTGTQIIGVGAAVFAFKHYLSVAREFKIFYLGCIYDQLLLNRGTPKGISTAIVQIVGGKGEFWKRHAFVGSTLDKAKLQVSFSGRGFAFHGLEIDFRKISLSFFSV